ncbi:hypothetical protein Dimus_001123 [Dionaea muscipula]
MEVEEKDVEDEDETEGKEEEDEESEEDEAPSISRSSYVKKSRWAFLTKDRLRVPSGKLIRSCMRSMMGAASRGALKALRELPLLHKFACLARSMAEMSPFTGSTLYAAVRSDDRKSRKINKLMENVLLTFREKEYGGRSSP